MDLGLKGVHVLVTGASGGIGLETTRLFLSQGALVSAHYRSNSQSLQTLVSEYQDHIRCIQADLEVEADVERAFKLAQTAFGHPVQVVVINHGYWENEDVPVAKMTLTQWNATLSVDLTSPFLVAREFLRGLEGATVDQKEKAAIVTIGSTAGKYGEANHADYAACKSALMYGLTLTLKNEIVAIAPKGRVNSVAPGWVYTPMAEEALKDPEVVYRSLATTPMKKFAKAFDVATQVVMLASSTVSGHVTGQVVMVEGGMEGRLLNRREDIV
ncbi:NAD-P-binding protein [Cristinia sonorae]|uniref:NAD-P-binding protein n=1 Tax=Cristinia sonorae TaxID=1940300 RepID=A0A8K0XJU5_9AGAR|nr:NAD-P-binding protein [Cristinia sonorae]